MIGKLIASSVRVVIGWSVAGGTVGAVAGPAGAIAGATILGAGAVVIMGGLVIAATISQVIEKPKDTY